MTITHKKNGDKLTIAISGRLDSTTSGEFTDFLEHNFTPDIQDLTLDFAEVDFISSKGLRVLVTLYKGLNGKQLRIINTNTSVKEVFRLSSLLTIFNIK